VGWYGAASRAVEALYVIPIMLTSATFPVLSRLWTEGPDVFLATLRKTLNVVLVISVPVAVTLLVLAQDIVSFLFTLSAFAPAVVILRIQAVTVPLVFVDYLLVCGLMAVGRERIWLAIVVAACFLDPALDWVLIRAADAAYGNGGIGAALATMLTEIFLFACVLRALPAGALDATSLRLAGRVALVAALQAAALVGLRTAGIPWVAAAALAGCGYGLAVLWLRLLPPDVLSWLGELIRRRAPRLVPAAMPAGAEATATSVEPPRAGAA
jgi:O-antigen/teichoic acid export membrane protein